MIEPSSTPTTFPDDVDVAVVSYNGRATLPRVLACLRDAAIPIDRVSLYDIGSTDGTAEWLAADWPGIRVRRLAENVGPNPARNWALRDASRPYLLLLDSDAFLQPDAPLRLRRAIDPLAHIGLVAPIVVHSDRPDHIQYAGVDLHFLCEAVNPWLNRPLDDRGLETRDVGTAAGVALLIHVDTARTIGFFDERYFMGKDDGDFCYRLRLAGYRLVEEPRAIVEHGSRPRSSWMFRYQVRNRWYFMLKNYSVRTLVVLSPALLVHEILQFGLLAGTGHLGAWWQACRDMARWMPDLPRIRREVQATRAVSDRALLVSAPLLIRDDLVRGGIAAVFKRLYDAWLSTYWTLAHLLLA